MSVPNLTDHRPSLQWCATSIETREAAPMKASADYFQERLAINTDVRETLGSLPDNIFSRVGN
jgi:hypothetical protein